MRKTAKPQTFGEALDRSLRYQQYKSITMLVITGLLYWAAKDQQRTARRRAVGV